MFTGDGTGGGGAIMHYEHNIYQVCLACENIQIKDRHSLTASSTQGKFGVRPNFPRREVSG